MEKNVTTREDAWAGTRRSTLAQSTADRVQSKDWSKGGLNAASLRRHLESIDFTTSAHLQRPLVLTVLFTRVHYPLAHPPFKPQLLWYFPSLPAVPSLERRGRV